MCQKELSGAAAITHSLKLIGFGKMKLGVVVLLAVGATAGKVINKASDVLILANIDKQLQTQTPDEVWKNVKKQKRYSKKTKAIIKDHLYPEKGENDDET